MIFETKPRKCVIERVTSMLSMHGVMFREEGRGGVPELRSTDFAAALAGLDDPVARHIVGALLGDQGEILDLGEALHRWGWMRWLEARRAATIDALLHARMAGAAVGHYLRQQEWPVKDLKQGLGVGTERWGKLRPHYDDLVGRLRSAESAVGEHLARRLRA